MSLWGSVSGCQSLSYWAVLGQADLKSHCPIVLQGYRGQCLRLNNTCKHKSDFNLQSLFIKAHKILLTFVCSSVGLQACIEGVVQSKIHSVIYLLPLNCFTIHTLASESHSDFAQNDCCSNSWMLTCSTHGLDWSSFRGSSIYHALRDVIKLEAVLLMQICSVWRMQLFHRS